MLDPVKGELNAVELEDIDKIYEFSLKHNIQVYLGSDHQYEVWIDGKGSYGSWITFFGALYGGVFLYLHSIENICSEHSVN